MDAEILYRTKLQEMEREICRMRLLAASREATSRGRPDDSAARRRPPMPLRLLRHACQQAGALRPSS